MAQALKFHAIVSGKTLSLPDLRTFEGKRVKVIVVEEEAPAEIGARHEDSARSDCCADSSSFRMTSMRRPRTQRTC